MTRALGSFVTPMAVRQAVKALLTAGNVGVYADEIVRQQHPAGTDLTDLRVERIRDVVLRETDRLPEHQLPCLVIRLPELRPSHRDGRGRICAAGTLGVMVVHASTDEDGENGEEIVAVLGRAVAGLLCNNLASEDGPIQSVLWARTRNAEVVDDDSRARHGVLVEFDITIPGVLDDSAGPRPDLPDPPIGEDAADPGDLPVIEETDLTTTPVEEIDP